MTVHRSEEQTKNVIFLSRRRRSRFRPRYLKSLLMVKCHQNIVSYVHAFVFLVNIITKINLVNVQFWQPLFQYSLNLT